MSQRIVRGRAWRFGDNVSTDHILPTKYFLATLSSQELASHAMAGADPDFVKRARPGDIIVGGANFGCGSSREIAVQSLKNFGLGAVVAEYFGRIFFRNSINMGLPVIEAKGVSEIADGDEVEIDLERGEVRDLTTGRVFKGTAIPSFLNEILNDGGLIAHLEKKFLS